MLLLHNLLLLFQAVLELLLLLQELVLFHFSQHFVVQVSLNLGLAYKSLVSLRELPAVLNKLIDFVKVRHQVLRGMLRISPSCCFIDDQLQGPVAND